MRPIQHFAATFAALALVAPAAAFAQAPDALPEAGDPEARRQQLNAQQAAAARAQVEANTASQAHHDTAVALTDMQIARDDARYADALTRNSEARQAYRQDRKDWERTNPHCWDGNAAQCPADPVPPPAR